MRRVAVSLAITMMVLASLATPTFAGRVSTIENDIFRITINAPDEAVAGKAFVASGTITLFDDGSGSRKPVYFELQGLNQQRAGVRAMQVGRTRSITKTYVVPANLPAGTYTITLAVSVDGRNALVERDITVRER
jgi:hypothetical protein